MRSVIVIALIAITGYATLASAAKDPANPQTCCQSMTNKGGQGVTAEQDTNVVRTHGGISSCAVSEVFGRR